MSDSHAAPPVSGRRRMAITAGLLMGMGLAALEATVVGTAMPTVIASLGGLAHYSWVFSAYLLTSTATVPIWGRLSDLFGRRRIYLIGIAMFLVGSMLSGASSSMVQLIVSRAIQGLGAGAIIPLSMTIVGELYTLEERAKTQALFSGVWGIASIAGPLVGGYITDVLSWRWAFYLNVPLGMLAVGVIALAYPPRRQTRSAQVDWAGAALMFAGTSALLLAIGGDTGASLLWLLASAICVIGFVVVERRAIEPILPIDLLGSELIARTSAVAFLFGASMFGAIAFVPLYLQGVLGASATEAGQVLTPLFLGWVVTSIVAAKLTARVGYRPIAVAGGVLLTLGFIGLAMLTPDSSRALLLASCLTMGAGMGFSMLSVLLAVQHGVVRSRLGIATSLNQFSRSIGAAIGIAAMGAILSRSLRGVSLEGGAGLLGSAAVALTGPARLQVASALHDVFLLGTATSAVALIVSFFLPAVDFSRVMSTTRGNRVSVVGRTDLAADPKSVS